MAMHANDALDERSSRLPPMIMVAVEEIARGIEEGEAGLKSCTVGAILAADNGASGSAVAMRHHHDVLLIDDEDECFNMIGEYLASGFTFAEVARRVRLSGSGVHLLALERWCQLARLECDVDEILPTDHSSRNWRKAPRFERRQRARRAFSMLRRAPTGKDHAAVLHIVYGWPDPFLRTLEPDARSALGREFGPLARYTDAVEERRVQMVNEAAARSPDPEAFGNWFAMRNLEASPRPDDGTIDLLRVRERRAYFEGVISSGDALRTAMAPPRGKREDETKDHYREHVQAPAKAAREALITQIRIEANRMLTDATQAFLDAWNRA